MLAKYNKINEFQNVYLNMQYVYFKVVTVILLRLNLHISINSFIIMSTSQTVAIAHEWNNVVRIQLYAWAHGPTCIHLPRTTSAHWSQEEAVWQPHGHPSQAHRHWKEYCADTWQRAWDLFKAHQLLCRAPHSSWSLWLRAGCQVPCSSSRDSAGLWTESLRGHGHWPICLDMQTCLHTLHTRAHRHK